MFDFLLDVLKGTVEWRQWGWNIPTIGAVGAASFALLQGAGVWKQGRRVHREREAQTLSFLLFGYSMAYFFSTSLYGWKVSSIALVLAAVVGILHIPVITGIPRYGMVSRREKRFVGVFFLMIPLMWLATAMDLHEAFFLVSIFGLLGFIAPQAWRAWKSADTSDLDPLMILSFLFGAFFWFSYAFAVDSLTLKLFNPLAIVLWTFILVMWWKKGIDAERKNEIKFKLALAGLGIILAIVSAQAIIIFYLTGGHLPW
ncbi:MAG: PQ-loop domain-containing transporter [Candidatus Brennerbacteria bacterium]